MKTIGILLPCYNEKGNVTEISNQIVDLFKNELNNYNYKIVFIDNCSTDGTVDELKILCQSNSKIGAIFNASNFNWYSSWHGIKNTPGDCVIQIPSDLQVPVSVIPQLINEWENGHDFVCGIKKASKENKIKWFIRRGFYAFQSLLSDSETLDNLVATLYDRKLLDECIKTEDSHMYSSLKYFMIKYSKSMSKIYLVQEKRKKGKSKNSLVNLFKIGITRITESSNTIPLITFVIGMFVIILAPLFLITNNIISGNKRNNNTLFLSLLLASNGVTMCFMGLMGEYLLKINDREKKWPGVIEKERINL